MSRRIFTQMDRKALSSEWKEALLYAERNIYQHNESWHLDRCGYYAMEDSPEFKPKTAWRASQNGGAA